MSVSGSGPGELVLPARTVPESAVEVVHFYYDGLLVLIRERQYLSLFLISLGKPQRFPERHISSSQPHSGSFLLYRLRLLSTLVQVRLNYVVA